MLVSTRTIDVAKIRNIIVLLKDVSYEIGVIVAPIPDNKQMLYILEPITFPTAKSESFFIAAITDVAISGSAVPIAITVILIIAGLTEK